jgi:hypothetical protein
LCSQAEMHGDFLSLVSNQSDKARSDLKMVTAVALGAFRTDWAGRSMIRSPRSITDYDLLFDPSGGLEQKRVAGDPAKAARVILKAVETDDPPMHLLLGNDALKLVRDKLNSLRREIDTWETVTKSTEYA